MWAGMWSPLSATWWTPPTAWSSNAPLKRLRRRPSAGPTSGWWTFSPVLKAAARRHHRSATSSARISPPPLPSRWSPNGSAASRWRVRKSVCATSRSSVWRPASWKTKRLRLRWKNPHCRLCRYSAPLVWKRWGWICRICWAISSPARRVPSAPPSPRPAASSPTRKR